jgi:hypothetical protein
MRMYRFMPLRQSHSLIRNYPFLRLAGRRRLIRPNHAPISWLCHPPSLFFFSGESGQRSLADRTGASALGTARMAVVAARIAATVAGCEPPSGKVRPPICGRHVLLVASGWAGMHLPSAHYVHQHRVKHHFWLCWATFAWCLRLSAWRALARWNQSPFGAARSLARGQASWSRSYRCQRCVCGA